MRKIVLIIILLVVEFSVVKSQTSCDEQDSLALVALYNNTNGDSWTYRTGWLQTGTYVQNWYGITLNADGYVINIALNNNNLDGHLPAELGNLKSLQSLSLLANKLTDSIPTEIGNLTNLQVLELRDNQLTGKIPTEIGNLTNLQSLSLANNQLTGKIPAEIGNLTNLQYLYLDFNQLTDTIPAEIGNLTNLQYLYLNANKLSGKIPTEIGNLTNLQFLSLSNNQLTGNIPTEIGNLSNLLILELQSNQLSGNIPTEIGNLTKLQTIDLEDNQLSGEIPTEIGNLTDLLYLYLSNNQLTGSIPVEIGNLKNLLGLNFYNNQLTGNIPTELGNLTSLISLNLSTNQITGNIPTQIGNMTALVELDLSYNKLTGEIPQEIGNLTNLTSLFLFYNELTGSIPTTLGNLTKLKWLYMRSNKFTGNIPTQLGNITDLTVLDLSDNQLTGGIPSELSKLENLETIELSGNQLSAIPVEISDITGLKNLDISYNKFDYLPDLSSLTSLGYCNVSNNNLDFGDLERAAISAENYYYSPQNEVQLYRTNTIPDTFYVKVDGTNNEYVWYQDGMVFPDSDRDSLVIPENGNYYCQITNADFPDLTLTSPEGYVNYATNSQDSLALVDLYNTNGGYNWSDKTGWLTRPVSDWFGVFTEYGRVVELALPNNNITGNITSSIGVLDSLRYLDFSGNHIQSVPFELGQLRKLRYLDLSSNELSAISNVAGLTALTDFMIADNGLTELPDLSNSTEISLVDVSNNYLDFGDLDNLNINTSLLSTWVYSPQLLEPEVSVTYYNNNATADLYLTNGVGGKDNAYEWINTEGTNSMIGESVNVYIPGHYYCVITNDAYPDLTIYSDTINVEFWAHVVMKVLDEVNAHPIEGADIYFNDDFMAATDTNGMAEFNVNKKDYYIHITANNFKDYFNDVYFLTDTFITVYLQRPTGDIIIGVRNINDEPIVEATVTLITEMYTDPMAGYTDNTGTVYFYDMPYGDYGLRIEKEGYSTINTNFTFDNPEGKELSFTLNYETIGLPNAFSPNGDGINDIYFVRIPNIYSFRLYDSNGDYILNVMYDEGKGGFVWDGTINGKPAKEGTYYFVLKQEQLDPNVQNLEGTDFSVIRGTIFLKR